MTVDQAVAAAAAEFDIEIDRRRRIFESSLIQNCAPPEHLELLLDDFQHRMSTWRTESLAELRASLLGFLAD